MLAQKTVRNHVSAILTKLGLTNRIEAATYAVRHDIERHLPGQNWSLIKKQFIWTEKHPNLSALMFGH